MFTVTLWVCFCAKTYDSISRLMQMPFVPSRIRWLHLANLKGLLHHLHPAFTCHPRDSNCSRVRVEEASKIF